MQTAYNKKTRKYAELSIKVKYQWQVEAVYTLPIIIYATEVIPHALHDFVKQQGLRPEVHRKIKWITGQ